MSTADEISKLHDLLSKGAISQAEFDHAKARLFGIGPVPLEGLTINRFRLSTTDNWIAGVCGGIGPITGVESWIWRLIFVLGMFLGGFTVLLYILLWIFVPREGQ